MAAFNVGHKHGEHILLESCDCSRVVGVVAMQQGTKRISSGVRFRASPGPVSRFLSSRNRSLGDTKLSELALGGR